jgi:hypothetical protein
MSLVVATALCTLHLPRLLYINAACYQYMLQPGAHLGHAAHTSRVTMHLQTIGMLNL